MKSALLQRCFISVFFLFLLVPGIGAITGLLQQDAEDIFWSELREKYAFSLHPPNKFNRWFNDHLGLRKEFFDMHFWLVHSVFGQSPHEERVQVGQGGFLFLGDRFFETFSRHAGLHPYSPEQLAVASRQYADFISALEKLGIPVLLVIPPDKATIYGEYYPSWSRPASAVLPKNFGANLECPVIFLAPALMEAKQKYSPQVIFQKMDTHWNGLGAFVGYERTMQAISRLLKQPLQTFAVIGMSSQSAEVGQDLARFLGMLVPQAVVSLDLKPPLKGGGKERDWLPASSQHKIRENGEALNDLEVLFFHDSFLLANIDVYKSTFSRMITVHIDHVKHNEQAIATELADGRIRPALAVLFLLERNVIPAASRLAVLTEMLERPGEKAHGH